jgi:hypothetical protein
MSEEPCELSADEEKAIRSLKRLAKTWPKSLWLFSASGTLLVMRAGENGDHVHLPSDGVDPDYALTTIAIPNDGGDW